ncbi:hypothetical protein AB0903_00345 [Streptomyces sp. NPDC048389]|uniref:hypothetical protein n=1 Tax=Streptomyces sp. NPDC048389 TaxID=3154622 RepID=UPI0034569D2A
MSAESDVMVMAGILALLYRITPTDMSEGPAGTATRNYVAEDREGGLSVSVTEYVAGAETAEGGLSGGRWAAVGEAVGEAVGRLHRVLACHPVGPPCPVASRQVCDIARAGRRLEELLAQWAAAPPAPEGFAAWCAQTAKRRLATTHGPY